MKPQPSPILLFTIVLITLLAVGAAGQNTAKVFTVTNTADSTDAAPGDGTCADAQGRCTLRAAVEEANAEPTGRDIIIFSLQYPAVIDLTLGPLVITGNGASIVGPGARRLFVRRSTGGPPFRIFHVPNQGTSAVIRGLSIHDGLAGQFISGGAIRTGPGTTLHLADASLRNNSGGGGGAILNEGAMTISRVLMASNAANVDGGAIATTPNSTTRILNTTITNNSAQTGGAIYAEGPILCINCTITHNSATISAGSIRSGAANEVALLNTIVGSDTSFPVTSLSGSFLSHGNNIVTDARDSTGFMNGVNGDQISDNNVINPLLGPLADNGGQTDTRALIGASPAINTGNSCVARAQCPMFPQQSQTIMLWDQRVNHSRGGFFDAVDIGAFELGTGSSSGSVGVGLFPVNQATFLYNSQMILTNVETAERIYRSIGPFGRQRFSNLPSGVVHVVEVPTKRSVIQPPPFVLAIPD